MKIERDGVAFRVEGDDDFWRDEFIGRNWERGIADVIRKHCPADWRFLDLGAWIGPWTLTAAALGRKVIAFEPDPVAFEHLNVNLALNAGLSPNVAAYNAAIGASEGSTRLIPNEGIWGGSNSGRFAKDNPDYPGRPIDVYRYPVADFVTQTTFVKIDIEGDELDVFPQIARLGAPCHLSIHAGLPKARGHGPVDFRKALRDHVASYGRLIYAGHRHRVDALPWDHNFEVLCLP